MQDEVSANTLLRKGKTVNNYGIFFIHLNFSPSFVPLPRLSRISTTSRKFFEQTNI